VSIGHGALMGIGAYACARITTELGWPIEAVLVAVIVLSVLSGLLFVLPLLRLSGHVMALATLALGQIGYLVMLNWMPVTRGPLGIGGIPEPTFAVLGGGSLRFPGSMTAVAFVVLIVGLGVVHLLSRGQLARNLFAIREDRLAAEASGVVASPHVIVAFVASSVVTGLAGMMFAYQQSYISPDSFLILTSFLMLTMVLVGGVVSPLGAVVGSILLIALPELLREYSEYRDVVYAVILILIIKYLPSGITSIRLRRRAPRTSPSERDGAQARGAASSGGSPQARESARPAATALPQDSVIPASEAAQP
jgi:branched-chain amino acid transport system permease protein